MDRDNEVMNTEGLEKTSRANQDSMSIFFEKLMGSLIILFFIILAFCLFSIFYEVTITPRWSSSDKEKITEAVDIENNENEYDYIVDKEDPEYTKWNTIPAFGTADYYDYYGAIDIPKINGKIANPDSIKDAGWHSDADPDAIDIIEFIDDEVVFIKNKYSDDTTDSHTEKLSSNFKCYIHYCDYTCRLGGDYCDSIYYEVTPEQFVKYVVGQDYLPGKITHFSYDWNDSDNTLIDDKGTEDTYDDIYDYTYLSSLTLTVHLNTDFSHGIAKIDPNFDELFWSK